MKKKSQIQNPFAHHKHRMRRSESRPILFDLSRAGDRAGLEKLLKSGCVAEICDTYTHQLRELFAIDNPPLALGRGFEKAFAGYHAALLKEAPDRQRGSWVFYPWLSTLVHVLPHSEFHRVRTARNRTLISSGEQKRFYDATIAIAGLSIGNSAALGIALQGGARRMKLADLDVMNLSNLNRIRAGVDSLGIPKVEITARQIYLIDPYAEPELFTEGLTEKNIGEFFKGADLVIDEFDDFAMKRLLREHAQKHRIPLISGADVGESAVIDVERYDTDPQTRPFHGRIPDMDFKAMKGLDTRAIGGLIAQLVGLENHNTRMLEWPNHLGQAGGIVSFPQLGGTALLNGSFVAYCAFTILAGYPVKNGRTEISLEHLFLADSYFSKEMRAEHRKALSALKKMLNIS